MAAKLEFQLKTAASAAVSPTASPQSAVASHSFGKREVQAGPVGDRAKLPPACNFKIKPDTAPLTERTVSKTFSVEPGQVRPMQNWIWLGGAKEENRAFNRTLAAQLSQILPGYRIPVCQTFLGTIQLSLPYINLDDPDVSLNLPRVTLNPSGGLCIHYRKDQAEYPKMHAEVLEQNKVVTACEIIAEHHLGPTLILTKPEEWLKMLRDFCKYTPKMFGDFVSKRENIESVTRNRFDDRGMGVYQCALWARDASSLAEHLGRDFLTVLIKFLEVKVKA